MTDIPPAIIYEYAYPSRIDKSFAVPGTCVVLQVSRVSEPTKPCGDAGLEACMTIGNRNQRYVVVSFEPLKVKCPEPIP